MNRVRLTERWRPKTFESVIGQREIVLWCKAQWAAKSAPHAAFVGPWGCGKTTLANLYGRSIVCEREDRITIDPCGECNSCKADARTVNSAFRDINSAQMSHIDVSEIVDSARMHSLHRRRVIHFDEADALSGKSVKLLLKVSEARDSGLTFLFSRQDAKGFSAALESRCASHRVDLLNESQLASFARVVCENERIDFDDDGIRLLVENAAGHVRDLLERIDQTSASLKRITGASVAAHLGLDYTEAADLLSALFVNDPQAALDKARSLQGTVASLRSKLLTFITDLELEHRGLSVSNVLFLFVEEGVRRHLGEKGIEFAKRQQLAGGQFWRMLHNFWFHRHINSLSDLERLILDSYAWLFETSEPRGQANERLDGQLAVQNRSGLRRPHVRPSRSKHNAFLSVDDVKQIWDAASFGAQQYGKYLNCSVFINHAELEILDDKASAALVSDFIKGLSARMLLWQKSKLIWLYVHRKTPLGISTTVALHLPEECAQKANAWIFQSFFQARFANLSIAAVTVEISRPSAGAEAARRHQALVRSLCLNIHPEIFLRAPMRRLADVLGVPASEPSEFLAMKIRRLHIAQAIGRSSARRFDHLKMGPLTPAHDGAWSYENWGWESKEHGERLKLILERQSLFADDSFRGQGARDPDLAAVQRDKIISSWSSDPTKRPRKWPTLKCPGWWHST